MHTETKVPTRIKRLNNSKWGNPNFEVSFDDATTARTKNDASDNYAISEIDIGRPVEVTFTRAGRICGWKRR